VRLCITGQKWDAHWLRWKQPKLGSSFSVGESTVCGAVSHRFIVLRTNEVHWIINSRNEWSEELYETPRCSNEADVYRRRPLLPKWSLGTVFPILQIRNKSISFSTGQRLVRLVLRSVYLKSLVEFFSVAGSVLGYANFFKVFPEVCCVGQWRDYFSVWRLWICFEMSTSDTLNWSKMMWLNMFLILDKMTMNFFFLGAWKNVWLRDDGTNSQTLWSWPGRHQHVVKSYDVESVKYKREKNFFESHYYQTLCFLTQTINNEKQMKWFPSSFSFLMHLSNNVFYWFGFSSNLSHEGTFAGVPSDFNQFLPVETI
jgi:hypothetical protein